ncbi:hypothetical protein LINGRAHAP2_LOCUS2936 [Linum grandiflorum]
MGNCLIGGAGEPTTAAAAEGRSSIRVITSTGAILEFNSPITASLITSEFPGHAIFPSHDLYWTPLSPHDNLLPGNSYYLLPVRNPNSSIRCSSSSRGRSYSSSSPTSSTSIDCSNNQFHRTKRPYAEAFSVSSSGGKVGSREEAGFWKVKLVISPDQLMRILSQEGSTHDLVHNVSTVAKCGSSYSNESSSASASASATSSSSASCSSDEWVADAMSTKSSRNGYVSGKSYRRCLTDFAVPS